MYCRELLNASFPGLRVIEEYGYERQRGKSFKTPDVLLYENDELAVIFECKVTRMSYDARFGENSITADERGYNEMAKGIFQVWRFVSHKRRGFLPNERFRHDVKGVVLTLDTWLSMATATLNDVFDRARVLCAEKDRDILLEDQIPVAFCSIEDLERTVSTATPESFLAAVRTATEKRFRGYMLWTVHRDEVRVERQNNEYPFKERIAEVLPWWNDFGNASS